jgi:hypothetical protein
MMNRQQERLVMADFFTDFNKGLDDAGKVVGAKFQVPPGGTNYNAISIDKLQLEERDMPGGKFQNVHTVLHVRIKVGQAAGLKDGTLLSAYGETLRLVAIEKEGDDSWTVLCGPAGVEVPDL